MSVNRNSFTNNDFIKAVNDVQQFNDADRPNGRWPEVLDTEEDITVSGVLVLETESWDAWDDFGTAFQISKPVEETEQNTNVIEKPVTETVVSYQPAEIEVMPDEEYWTEDNEIIIDNESFMFIKPALQLVYSDIEPGRWAHILQRGGLSKLPLRDSWRPNDGLQVYPISRLLWVNTLINETDELFYELDDNTEYLLERWPHFELLELDNVLVRLCTMLIVRPQSLNSLATKSGYGRSTIIGLLNACQQMGLLKPAELDLASCITNRTTDCRIMTG